MYDDRHYDQTASDWRAACDYAEQRGREEGVVAASWVFDGNTSIETYARYHSHQRRQ